MNRTPYSFLFKVPRTCLALNSYTKNFWSFLHMAKVTSGKGHCTLLSQVRKSLPLDYYSQIPQQIFPNAHYAILGTSLNLCTCFLHHTTYDPSFLESLLRIKLIVHLRIQQLVSQKIFTIPIRPSDNAHLAHILPKRFKTIHLNLWRI